HRLEELDAVSLAERLDGRQVEGVALGEGARRRHRGRAVADDLQPPRLGGEAGAGEGLALEGVWAGVAAADVLEVGRGGQEGPLAAHRGPPRLGSWRGGGKTTPLMISEPRGKLKEKSDWRSGRSAALLIQEPLPPAPSPLRGLGWDLFGVRRFSAALPFSPF